VCWLTHRVYSSRTLFLRVSDLCIGLHHQVYYSRTLSLGVFELCVGLHHQVYSSGILIAWSIWLVCWFTNHPTFDILMVYCYPTNFTLAFPQSVRAGVLFPASWWVHNFLIAPTQVFWPSKVALPVFSHAFSFIASRT